MSRGVILKRRLPTEFGGADVFVTPEARLNLWRTNLLKTDPDLFAAVRHNVRAGDVIWDVGANVGLFSVAAAALSGRSGRVIAIEADEWLCGILRRSAKRQQPENARVEVLSVALSGAAGVLPFHIAERGRAVTPGPIKEAV